MLKHIIKAGLVAALIAFGSPALAATLYITEFASPISQSQSSVAQNLGQPAISTQTVSISAGSLQSAAFSANTRGIQAYCDSGCSVVVGPNPIATTANQVLTGQAPQTFTVQPGQKIAVIANPSGTPSGGGGGGGGAVTIADGADVTEGAIADAASTAGGAGTVSAKLRRLTAQLPAALDANGNLKSTLFDSAGVALTYNANGQASAANSTPVVGATGTIGGGSTGTAGSAASTVVTVQGVTSMTPVQVSQATGTNLHTVLDSGTLTTLTTLTGTTTLTPGTGATNLGKAEDAAATSGDTGVGALAVQTATPADAATDGDYAYLQMKNGLLWTAAVPTPAASGALTTFFLQPTASDNHANIKNGAGTVYHIRATNNSATINYLRLYNAATGFNGCNSATNLVTQIAVPASTSGAGFVDDNAIGDAYSTGISICVTSGYATTDTTNATASAMSITISYK